MEKILQKIKTGFNHFNRAFHFKTVSITALAVFAIVGWIIAIHYYRVATAIPLISDEVLAEQTLAQTTVNAQWQTFTVKPRETMQTIFKHLQLGNQQLAEITKLGQPVAVLKKLKPGQQLRFLITDDNQLQQLIYPLTDKTNLSIVRNDNGFTIENENSEQPPAAPAVATQTQTPSQQPLEKNISNMTNIPMPQISSSTHYGYAILQKSLYEGGIQAGLSHRQAMQLVTLFSQSGNLARNIRKGDQLTVLYQKDTNYILFAQLTHRGKTYQIFRFTDPKGNTDYYTQDGNNLHPPLVRAPLNYSHISSTFSDHRWQPILHFFRPHYGVDYAAPTGTPIKAAGNGKIIFWGGENGYGNVVKIQHIDHYETVYAHMSRFAKGLHQGSIVKQGQIIGYVGDTGLSTGSHLHFEIRINNTPHNPLTVALPTGTPMPGYDRDKFYALTKQMMGQIAIYQQPNKLAANINTTNSNTITTNTTKK